MRHNWLRLVTAVMLAVSLLVPCGAVAAAEQQYPPDFEYNNDYTQVRLDDRVYPNYTILFRLQDGAYIFMHEAAAPL
ncbi:MAG: hypothetical protein L6E13_11440, partial [Firmicutes bacterium]|nr:hypothetical protein [Bacillota bacterium]